MNLDLDGSGCWFQTGGGADEGMDGCWSWIRSAPQPAVVDVPVSVFRDAIAGGTGFGLQVPFFLSFARFSNCNSLVFFSSRKFLDFVTIILSFLFYNYYSIID